MSLARVMHKHSIIGRIIYAFEKTIYGLKKDYLRLGKTIYGSKKSIYDLRLFLQNSSFIFDHMTHF